MAVAKCVVLRVFSQDCGRGAALSANGARDLSRRNVRTAQTHSQNPKTSLAYQHPCGLKSALRSANGARDLSRRKVRTTQTHSQNPKTSLAYQHPCGLKSALHAANGALGLSRRM